MANFKGRKRRKSHSKTWGFFLVAQDMVLSHRVKISAYYKFFPGFNVFCCISTGLQGHKRKCSPKKKKVFTKIFQAISKKKKKERSSQKFFKRSPRKNVFQKIFQPLHKILTIQKIVLSSSRGQANFRGLEASRPRPRT